MIILIIATLAIAFAVAAAWDSLKGGLDAVRKGEEDDYEW